MPRKKPNVEGLPMRWPIGTRGVVILGVYSPSMAPWIAVEPATTGALHYLDTDEAFTMRHALTAALAEAKKRGLR